MIEKLIQISIKNRSAVICGFLAVSLFALYSLKTARIDAIPDIGENQQIVFTEWPGRSPKDVEEQITYPLSLSLQGIAGVKNVRGMSAFGFSTIYVIFEEKVDYYWSRSRVLEKLSTVSQNLPTGTVPKMGPDATGLGQIFWYTVENSEDAISPRSLAQLRSIQDFHVRYLLQGVKGVSEVASVGGFVKEYQIDVDPKKLFAFDVHFSAVVKAIKNSNVDVGAEVMEDGSREFIVRGKGFFKSLDDIRDVVVAVKENSPVRIKDLATVGTGPAFRRGAIDRDGTEAVGGVVAMRYGENPKEVITRLKERLEIVKKGLPNGVTIRPFYDRTELIDKTLATVYRALGEQILITTLVIVAFLLHFRSSVLVSLTLPLGVGISFIFMKLFSIDSNIMSLSGLVIAIGSMVDMGIIMTENIYAKLAPHPKSGLKERIRLIGNAATEVGPAILTAVLTTIISFLPVFALTGPEGKLFGPLAWSKTLAMFGSVVVAILLIPAVSVFFLKGRLRPAEKNKVSGFILNLYRPALGAVLNHRRKFLMIPVLMIGLGVWAFGKLGSEFMPSLNEGDILYMPVTTPDVSMTQARELLSYTDKKLNEHPLVETAIGKLGRVDSALDPAPVAMFETTIKLVPPDKWPSNYDIFDVMADLDKHLQVPGLVNSWDFPIQTRVAMISTGIKTQVGIKIFGDRVETLEKIGAEIAAIIQDIPGARGVYAEKISGKPYIEFDIDRVAASRYGINTGTINTILQTAVGGMPTSQFYDGRKRYPIRVRYKKEFRDRIDDLKQVLVPSPLGYHIPISQLADIKVTMGPSAIQSENGMLRSTVQLNVEGRDVVGFVEKAKRLVEKTISLPEGYSIIWAGQYENQKRANQRLAFLIPLSLLISFFIIFVALKKFANTATVFSAVPVAFAGGLILLWSLDLNTSVAVWVGFIALAGIAVDDGVVMMTYLQSVTKTSKPENWKSLCSAIIEAGTRRIRPMIMTTVTTVAALSPVLWSTSTGSEIMKPMAIPVIGGMMMTLVSLFIVPVLYSFTEQKRLNIHVK